jgi:hypothetical protein
MLCHGRQRSKPRNSRSELHHDRATYPELTEESKQRLVTFLFACSRSVIFRLKSVVALADSLLDAFDAGRS